jgi:hypothetical protein
VSTPASFVTPMATVNLTINNNQDDDNNLEDLTYHSSFPSSTASTGKRQRNDSGIRLQPLTTDNRTTSFDAGIRNDDDEDAKHYENNRLKQERLLFITNICRFSVVCILAPILYAMI